MRLHFHIFANAALGKGLSGSDRIFIELSRRWRKVYPVTIHVWREGYEIILAQNLRSGENLKFVILQVGFWCKLGFVICYFIRIIQAIRQALVLKIDGSSSSIIYSASEFWMDSLPALILKLKFPKIRWIAAWYQTAPNPFKGFKEGERKNAYRLSALYYWLMQLPIKPLIAKWADLVLVNNEMEKRQFSALDKTGRVKVLLGAVNIGKNRRLPKVYEGVFQGRFHPQKGVVELIDIWKMVVERVPHARLIMIGDGPLMQSVKLKVKKEKLEKNITLTGYLFDGPQKYKIFSQSKIVLHPAFYDSGGMAAAEAMAYGLPAVGFDLKSYKSYYPKGMIKIKIGDLNAFAKKIIELIKNQTLRQKVGQEAFAMIRKNWSWEKRAEEIINYLTKK